MKTENLIDLDGFGNQAWRKKRKQEYICYRVTPERQAQIPMLCEPVAAIVSADWLLGDAGVEMRSGSSDGPEQGISLRSR